VIGTSKWKEIEQRIVAPKATTGKRLTAAGTGQKGGRALLACGKPAFLRCFCG
jgi:hypothetical protein